MNCKKFESIASDLACGHLMEAGLRAGAIDHAAKCARCAAHLSDERLLATTLRAAAVEETAAAPSRVKANLLAEFRQRQPSQVAPPTIRRALSRWAIAAAAAAFVLVAIPVVGRLIQTGEPVRQTQVTLAPSSKETTRERDSLSDARKVSGDETGEMNNPGASADKISPVEETGKRRVVRKPLARVNEKASANEATTEFIPLTYLSDRTAMASGTVVRVEMARSTLLAMGLPVSVDRADETITADVVVGDDGLARAIRIVY